MKEIKLCKAVNKKWLEESPEQYAKLIYKSKFFCLKCGLSSNQKERLCKPKKISKYIKEQETFNG